jgi:DNA-binding MarR family transcriptional regulator
MSARETAELLVQVGRRVQAEGYDGELSPAQWMALRFFARANQFSRNPSAFAGFQATTRGTATQTIKSLESGGYLVRQPSKADRRSISLRLTSKGKKALALDPARRGFARRERPKRDAPRPTPSAVHSSYEWCASADRCLSGLHALRQIDALQPAKRGPFGRRMPAPRCSDSAIGRGSSMRPISAKREPRWRTR